LSQARGPESDARNSVYDVQNLEDPFQISPTDHTCAVASPSAHTLQCITRQKPGKERKACISPAQAVATGGVVRPLVAAFDEVHRLAKGGPGRRLSLRFSYIQLKCAIDALNETATKARLRGLVQRKRGYSNASLAIDIYLSAKRNDIDETLSRNDLSEYRRVSMRWSQLVRASPLQLSVYSDLAETIMYVSSGPTATDTKSLKAATTQSSLLAYRHLLIWCWLAVTN
jgi:hypothetical protein